MLHAPGVNSYPDADTGRCVEMTEVAREAGADDMLWRAEVLAPLRATVACMEGRLQEQEAALGRATREAEHASAKQRRAERLAGEASERCEWLERKLDMAKHAAEASAAQLEQYRSVEARAEAWHTELKKVKEQLMLIARSHREQEEHVAAAATREAALNERLIEAERGRAANERAAAAFNAAEERHSAELSKLRAQAAQAEGHAAEAAVRLDARLREAGERARHAEERADRVQHAHDALRLQCEEQAKALDEMRVALRSKEAVLRERVAAEEELRGALARAADQLAVLKEAQARAKADAQAEHEAHVAALAEREARVRTLEDALEQRRAQLQKTVALGAQMKGIQQMLEELGSLDAAAS